jgi:putative protease
MTASRALELVCPAGTPAALRAAADAGADSIYCGFRDETNARNFPGLNFSREEMAESVRYAHARNVRVFVAINTFPRAGALDVWHRAVDDAARLGADAVILADLGLLAYAAKHHPGLRRHLSVQAAAANADAIRFYVEAFGVKRVVLPRVLTVAEIAAINAEGVCETEVFVFGGLCVMAEGRCLLSSYATGKSPNMNGVCSPASHVHYREESGELVSRLGDFTIDRVVRDAPAPYPTLCKGAFVAGGYRGHVFEDPVSLDAATLLPQLAAAGVTALKIEGRQRSRSYVRDVVSSFRRAVVAQAAGAPIAAGELRSLSEGQATTAGAYRKTWR